MKYCMQCGSEYQDSVVECADCPGNKLVGPEALRQRHISIPGEKDTQKFVRAGSVDDPLTAEEFVRVLEAQNIPVFSRPRRAGTVDALTTGTTAPWWEIMVPEEHLAQATALMAQTKAALEATAAEAAQAAEEEELESENPSAPGTTT